MKHVAQRGQVRIRRVAATGPRSVHALGLIELAVQRLQDQRSGPIRRCSRGSYCPEGVASPMAHWWPLCWPSRRAPSTAVPFCDSFEPGVSLGATETAARPGLNSSVGSFHSPLADCHMHANATVRHRACSLLFAWCDRFEDDCCLEWRSGALAEPRVAARRGGRSRRPPDCPADPAVSRACRRRCC